MRLANFGFGAYARSAVFLFALSILIIALQNARVLHPQQSELENSLGYGVGYEIIPILGTFSIVMAGLTTGTWFRFLPTPFGFFGESLMIILVSIFLLIATVHLNKAIFCAEIKKTAGILFGIYAVSVIISIFL